MSAGPTRMHTLEDVAALAGVSRSTVSNVVRGSALVAPDTRRRVTAAIDKLGYRPNALARQLRRGRASLIGVVMHDLRNPFMAEIATLVEREVGRFGFGAMFCMTEGDQAHEEGAISLFLDNRVSGIVVVSYLEGAARMRDRIAGSVATMFIAATEPWADSVSVDERRGGELVADHLLGLGHRRLAFVSPGRLDTADSLRLDGFRRHLAVAGAELVEIRRDAPSAPALVDGSTTDWSSIILGEPRITGYFASSDFLAIDLLDQADAVGVRVPEEISLVGFDDVSFASLRRIGLTTVHQPRHELARLGVEGIVGRIEGRIDGPPTVTLAGVDLRVRDTTGPACPRVGRGGGLLDDEDACPGSMPVRRGIP